MRRMVLGMGAIAVSAAIGFMVLTVWPIGATPSPELASLTGGRRQGCLPRTGLRLHRLPHKSGGWRAAGWWC